MNTQRLVTFLKGLRANNSKVWFEAHRSEYESLRSEFTDLVEHVIGLIGVFDRAVRGASAKQSIYRIHRDTRFAKDKSPYKTTFGAAIEPGGGKGRVPGYHFHIDAKAKLLVAGGLYMPTPAQVVTIRRAIDRQPLKLERIVAAPAFRRVFGGLDQGDALTRPPRGYSPDHPAIDLLKLRRFAAWNEVAATGDLVKKIATSSRILHPLMAYLREAIG